MSIILYYILVYFSYFSISTEIRNVALAETKYVFVICIFMSLF